MNLTILCLIGFICSLTLMLILMPIFIKVLKSHQITQRVSEYSLDEYKQKAKTPIMGGLLFVVIPIIVYTIIDFKGYGDRRILFILLSYISFCLVGFADDFVIVIKNNNDGISPRAKLIMEFIFSVALYFGFNDVITNNIIIGSISIDLGILYLPFMVLMFLGEANATNFTDGMDGLCAGVSFIGLIALAIILLCTGYSEFVVFITTVLGAILGYLFFNYHPAKIFMGDSGSLALGALFSSLAVVSKNEVLLILIGGVFLIEMFCVCLQLTSVKLFHKRVFSYTPIHYAFIIKGYKETSIVPCFYLVELVFCIIAVIIGLA